MNENLMNVLMPIAIMGVLQCRGVLFTKVLTDYQLRKRMVDKGFVNEETQAIFKQHKFLKTRPLPQMGFIILFSGLALILMETFLPVRSLRFYGVFSVFVSLALIYYFMVEGL